MKWVVGVAFALVFIGVLSFFFVQTNTLPSMLDRDMNTANEERQQSGSVQTPFDARFVIFTNGTQRTFDNAMYHNQDEDVFIPTENPRVVRVMRDEVTWQEFFDTLPFSLNSECLTTGTGQTFCDSESGALEFVLNGERVADALPQRIGPGDRLLVTFGSDQGRIERELLEFSR